MNLNDRRKEPMQTNSSDTMANLKALLQGKSSENLKLQTALQDATMRIQTMSSENLNLKAKLQEKTENEVNYEKKIASLEEQIAMMNESDLLWKRAKEQERKNGEESKQLCLQKKELEQKRLQQRSEHEKRLKELEEKEAVLGEEEDKLNEREQGIAQKEADVDKHIHECAKEMIAHRKRELESEHARRKKELESGYQIREEDRKKKYESRKRSFSCLVWGCFLFCIMIFIYEMIMATELRADVISFLIGVRNLILDFVGLALTAGNYVGSIANHIPQETVAGILYYLISAIVVIVIIGVVLFLLVVSIRFIVEAFMEHMGDTLSLGVAIYAATTIAFFSHQLKCWISWNYVGAFAFIYCAYIFTRVLLQMENEKVKMIIMKCLIGAAGLLGAVKFILFVFAMRKG